MGAVTISFSSDYSRPRTELKTCAKCGGRLLVSKGVHAPHFVARGVEVRLVDCVGNDVVPVEVMP